MKNKYSCPGHEGICKFCKSKYGSPRSVGGMSEIDRLTGERKVDPCCKSCANNLARQKKFYERTSLG
mgnify:CR=1 FL=1